MRLLAVLLAAALALFCGPAAMAQFTPIGFDNGTITTGGTAQNLFSGVRPANGWQVCNPDGTNALWVSDTTTAAANASGSIAVAALSCYAPPLPGSAPNVLGAVSIVGANTGQKYTARRW